MLALKALLKVFCCNSDVLLLFACHHVSFVAALWLVSLLPRIFYYYNYFPPRDARNLLTHTTVHVHLAMVDFFLSESKCWKLEENDGGSRRLNAEMRKTPANYFLSNKRNRTRHSYIAFRRRSLWHRHGTCAIKGDRARTPHRFC